MNTITVNQNDIKAIRPCLQLSLFALIQYMSDVGWDVLLTMPRTTRGDGRISFSKRGDWNDRPMLPLKISYGYPILLEDINAVQSTAQRAAELCLTVAEVFGPVYPSNPNIYGVIVPDRIANQSRHSRFTYQEWIEHQKESGFAVRRSKFNSAGFMVTRDNISIFLRDEDIPSLKCAIVQARRTLTGVVASFV